MNQKFTFKLGGTGLNLLCVAGAFAVFMNSVIEINEYCKKDELDKRIKEAVEVAKTIKELVNKIDQSTVNDVSKEEA